MSRSLLNCHRRLFAGLLLGLAASASAQADDIGVARVSDRPVTVVRGQSPEFTIEDTVPDTTAEPGILPAQCADEERGYCPADPGSVLNGGSAAGCPGGTCPAGQHGGIWVDGVQQDAVYYNGCPNGSGCRLASLFGGGSDPCPHGGPGLCPFGDRCRGHWGVDRHGNPVWIQDYGFCHNCDVNFQKLGDKFFRCLRNFDKKHSNGQAVPLVGHYRMVYPLTPNSFDSRDGQVYAAQGYGAPVSVPLAPIVRHTYNYGWGVPSSRLTPISHPVPYGTP